MIYLFTWNNNYLINQEVLRWKNGFIEKHGEENVTHISSLDWNTKNTISETLVSRSIFAEKRLVIVSGFPFSWEKSFAWAAELEEQINSLIPEIPDEVLLVFSCINPDKRKKWWKTLSSSATIKQFNINWEDEVFNILQQKYRSKIEPTALRRLILIKWWNLQKSISEIEKLLISPLTTLSKHDRGDYQIISSDVDSFILPEFEESIFVFIDTLLQRNWKKIFSELINLIDSSNLYAVYQSILANLRVYLYIELLKSQKKSSKEIWNILKLWNRAFLVNKAHKSKFKSISSLYNNLLEFDKNMKLWRFTSSDPTDMHRELENVFVKFLA